MNNIARSHPLSPSAPAAQASPGLLYETLIVLGLTLVPSLIWPQAKGALVFLPVTYLLIDHFARRRPWGQIGLRREGFLAALAANWQLILLVGIIIQLGVVVLARLSWPALLVHIQSRVPLFDKTTVAPVFGLLLVSTFIEELTFRGLFQERLSWYMPAVAANLIVSAPFALLHMSAGAPAMVALDVVLVALDSLLYGWIYTRGHNLWVAWSAHALADIAALVMLLAL